MAAEGLEAAYQSLASAIVEQATIDLRKAIQARYRAQDQVAAAAERLQAAEAVEHPTKEQRAERQTARRELMRARQRHVDYDRTVREIEGFFFGDWCAQLTDLDGPTLMEEVERDERLRHRKGGA